MDNVVKTSSGNTYLYSNKYETFIYIPDDKLELCESSENSFSDFSDDSNVNFVDEISDVVVNRNLANMRQVLIEVTDCCNLQCKYCGYGDLYDNYDKRYTKNQKFEDVKPLLDYLIDLWKSPYNISFKKNITIGFYGGEPLLNMTLIKSVIEYLESFHDLPVTFSYNMTTNAVLLDRYIDFLSQKNFDLLISLDGNRANSMYRVSMNGKESFDTVYRNVKFVQSNYRDYFDEKVNFNAVLHDLNTIHDIVSFIKSEFGKIPRIAELNPNGLSKNGIQEMKRMFQSKIEALKELDEDFLRVEMEEENPLYSPFHSFIKDFSGNYFNDYIDLFDTEDIPWVPTGTCMPFERKLFLTVNGKILPCEKVGQKRVLGYIKDKQLHLTLDDIKETYSSSYRKLLSRCSTCFFQKHCSQCIFVIDDSSEKGHCPGYITKDKAGRYLSSYLSYMEENRHLYNIMSNIITD